LAAYECDRSHVFSSDRSDPASRSLAVCNRATESIAVDTLAEHLRRGKPFD